MTTYTERILSLQPQVKLAPLVRAGYLIAKTEAAEIGAEADARIAELEAEITEIRQYLLAVGVGESEGGGGDTYYRKDTAYMAKELAQRINLDCVCGWDYKSHGFYADCTCSEFSPVVGQADDAD